MSVGLLVTGARAADLPTGPLPSPLRFQRPDGSFVTLDAPGKVYLVDFWAGGCKPCTREAPDLARLAREFGADGRFEIVAPVYGGWRHDQIERLATQYGMAELPVVADPDGWFMKLDVEGYPTKLLVRDGVVLVRELGGGRGTYRKWAPRIREALGKVPPTATPTSPSPSPSPRRAS
ncbi:MAG TPA: TlpA disulfide reductase family protein [Candidatus Polarisedimenticolaceae bacterium]